MKIQGLYCRYSADSCYNRILLVYSLQRVKDELFWYRQNPYFITDSEDCCIKKLSFNEDEFLKICRERGLFSIEFNNDEPNLGPLKSHIKFLPSHLDLD